MNTVNESKVLQFCGDPWKGSCAPQYVGHMIPVYTSSIDKLIKMLRMFPQCQVIVCPSVISV